VSSAGDAAALRAALLGDGSEGTVARFLAGRGAQSHIVAERSLVDALPADPARGFTWSPTLDDVPDTARAIYVDAGDDELAQCRAATARFPGRRVWGLRHHVAPMLVGDGQPLKNVPDDFRVESLRRFAIVCPARSGSTYFSQMLGQVGAGRAREHLRDVLLPAIRSRGVDRAELWRQLAWRAAREGTFGTKLVGEFLLAAAGEGSVAELLATLAPEGVPVIALHRPVIDTVVSRHVAGVARQFHVRGMITPQERARFEDSRYDAARLRRLLEANLAENRIVEEALARLPAHRVLHVNYADLDAQPMRTVLRAAAFLGVEADLRALRPAQLPIKISARIDSSARIRSRFIDDLRAEGRDVDALMR
jgi:hypothetical protein